MCISRWCVETTKWWDQICRTSSAVCWDQRRKRFSFRLPFLFYSSCARSGRAMGSSTNTNPSTWWGESSALHVVFPWGSAGAVHNDARGPRRMRSSLGKKEFSMGLETRRCVPPSVKACRNIFLMIFVCLWQKLLLFGRNVVLLKRISSQEIQRYKFRQQKHRGKKLLVGLIHFHGASISGLTPSIMRESSEKKKIPTGHQILLSACLIQLWFVILAMLYFKK